MTRLPVIVGFGGFNAAGRCSFHQSYQRTVLQSLSEEKRKQTLAGLAVMMNLVKYEGGKYLHYQDTSRSLSLTDIEREFGELICNGTLVREISKNLIDVDKAPYKQKVAVSDQAITVDIKRKDLPNPLPEGWALEQDDPSNKKVKVSIAQGVNLWAESYKPIDVHAAGQLPEGFDPAALYKSLFHPRALQMAIVGASDAVNSLGIDWKTILDAIKPDELAAYSSSLMSQLDERGLGGLMQTRSRGERAGTKQLPLGLVCMPTDFVNAYVLGNLGATGTFVGACASFLYGLRAGIEDIQSGRRRVVVVSSSEAPLVPEVLDGYAAMGALATREKLQKLDGDTETDLRRASRPFGNNCGFTMSESTQHVILMDDALAMELGAQIHGAVTNVSINGDGFKKSISAPGAGNYLTMGNSVAHACSLFGRDYVARHSFVQAHGSSTPQNRVTESDILERVAKAFGIESWPIAAIKAYVGHSLASASGDQLTNTLGVLAQGILPGIKTVEAFANDVLRDNLSFAIEDRFYQDKDQRLDIAFLNSKGFGGNNASATVLSPALVEEMLGKRYDSQTIGEWRSKLQTTLFKADNYNQGFLKGDFATIYRFGQNMINEEEIELDSSSISIPGYEKPVVFEKENLYNDMC